MADLKAHEEGERRLTTGDLRCLSQPQKYPEGWKLGRRPHCNRIPGHDGPHREYDVRTYQIRAEWTDADVRVR